MVEYNYSAMGKNGSKLRWAKEHAKVRISNKISKEKAAIMAYLSGDGYIKVRKKGFHYELGFFLDDFHLAKRIVYLFKKEFNITPEIKKMKSKIKNGFGYYTVRISNKPTCFHLLSISKYSGLDWGFINSPNRNLIKEWIKCFFDCEAYVNLRARQIQVKSVNGMGLNDIQKNLLLFEINSKVYGPYDNGANHNPYFMLCIYTLSDIKKYRKLIGFYHRDKMKDLQSF